ncbi:MAG: fibronectin type III domain-containing protein, partial [Treponema sp.]|nr:fibronectin type III domain-containing protein [Treponema sp.]
MKKIKTLTVILVLTICCGVFMWNCDDSNEAPSNTKTENEYTVTVINGTADKTKAYAKDTVTLLTYTLPDGQAVEFSDWTIDPSTVVMTSGNKFTMPSANVTVTANFTAYDPEANRPYYITNNFGQDSSRDLLVQWHNKTDIPAQTLQIVAAAGSFNNPEKTITVTGNKFSATNTEAPFIGDFESRNVFKADVTGLKANTFYKYRMGTEG